MCTLCNTKVAVEHVFDGEQNCKTCGVTDSQYLSFTPLEDGSGYGIGQMVTALDEANGNSPENPYISLPTFTDKVKLPDYYNETPITKLTGMTINVTVIEDGEIITEQLLTTPFAFNSSLTNIELPKFITEIPSQAFYECTALESVSIPDSVTSIGEEAFFGCKSLTSIEIPDSVTSIGERALMNCEALTDVALPDGITLIEDYMFYRCSALESVELPNSITSIGNYAFYGCSTLKSVKLPDGITSFSTEMFSFCTSLEEITISQNVTEIGRYCFYKCENLKSVKFDDSTGTWNILRIVSPSKNEYLTDFTPTNDTAANAKALTDTYSINIWTKQTND